MNSKHVIVVFAVVLSLVFVGCGLRKKEITIAGSTTAEAVVKQTAELFEKKKKASIRYIPTGSLHGLTMLLGGKCDIAVSTVKLPNAMLWDAQKKGVGIKEFIVAYDAIAIIVNKSNKADSLFLGQISDMFTGLLKDWESAAGSKGAITTVERDEHSGTRSFMHTQVFESPDVAKTSVSIKTNRAVVAYVSSHRYAIGYVSRIFVDNTVRVLKIQGFEPSDSNIISGNYPVKREVYAYVSEKGYKDFIRAFIDLMLSTEGQGAFKNSGFIPVREMKGPLAQ